MVITDHSALQYLKKIQPTTGRLFRWVLALECYDYEVKHKPGAQNKVADALSRRIYDKGHEDKTPLPEETLILNIEPTTLQNLLKVEQQKYPSLITQIIYEEDRTLHIPDPVLPICTLTQTDIAKAQRECKDFQDIYNYLENSILPPTKKQATKIVAEAAQYVLIDNILYHIFSPWTKGVPNEQK